MAYLNDREHDIFVSYAHIDDEVTHWVKQFVQFAQKEMERLLRIKEGHSQLVDLTIWKDNQLPRQGNLSDRLDQTIRESSILLVIMSKSYLLSEWCNQEGITFVNSLKTKSDLRIFIAEKEETDRSQWPEFLKTETGDPLLSRPFYEEIDVGQPPKTIPMKTPQGAADPRAARIMEDFCNDLSNQLHEFKHFTTVSNLNSQTKLVYLAVSPEGNAHRYRDRLVELLARYENISILPPAGQIAQENFDEILKNNVQQCDLFVQILDSFKGLFLSNYPTGFVGHQFDVALNLEKKILHWVDPELDLESVKDPNYRQFLNNLESYQNDQGTVVQGTLEEFAQEIVQKLNEVDRPHPPPRSGTFFVAIKSDIQDQEYAKKVGEEIEKYKSDIPFTLTLLYPNPQITAKELDLLTSSSNGIVIIWGKVDFEWVLSEINWLNQVVTSKVKAGALAICDPCPKEFEVSGEFEILNMSSDSAAVDRKASIDTYLNELNQLSLH